jgi:hypothetical protein
MSQETDRFTGLVFWILLALFIQVLWKYRHNRILWLGYLLLMVGTGVGQASLSFGFSSGKLDAVIYALLGVSFVCLLVGGLQALVKYRKRLGGLESSAVLQGMLEKQEAAKTQPQNRLDQ